VSRQNRKYELKARAEKLAETRRRIVEAAAALHTEVGPAQTTVAEIARRAGVQRPTVYNHFPDMSELFAACGDYSLARNPPPDTTRAITIGDPAERVGAILRVFYAWYRQTARGRENLQRDRLLMPALDAAMGIGFFPGQFGGGVSNTRRHPTTRPDGLRLGTKWVLVPTTYCPPPVADSVRLPHLSAS